MHQEYKEVFGEQQQGFISLIFSKSPLQRPSLQQPVDPWTCLDFCFDEVGTVVGKYGLAV